MNTGHIDVLDEESPVHSDSVNVYTSTHINFLYPDYEDDITDSDEEDFEHHGFIINILDNNNPLNILDHFADIFEYEYQEEQDNDKSTFSAANLEVVKSDRHTTKIINEICYICLDKLNDSEQIAQINNCQHGFCSECLFNWLKQHCSCPVCRVQCTIVHLVK